jgi:hypothetical protein
VGFSDENYRLANDQLALCLFFSFRSFREGGNELEKAEVEFGRSNATTKVNVDEEAYINAIKGELILKSLPSESKQLSHAISVQIQSWN